MYQGGLHEVGADTWAYLQPDGSWGYSNAGLVAGDDTSLLVDTLFDLRLTRLMLEEMRRVVEGRPIGVVVNTHANGDHCFGNQLLAGARIFASKAAAREMDEVPPTLLQALKQLDLGEDGNRFVAEAFGPFRFDDIELMSPTDTFSGSTAIEIGARTIVLEEVGPAHTAGDVIAWLPESRVVFTGDILFLGSTPIIWAGPVGNWLAACRRIRELGPSVVVPGHGPVSDVEGVAQVESYLEWLLREASVRQQAGLSALDAAWDLDLGEYNAWGDRERTVVNVDAIYAELEPAHDRMDAISAMREMGRYRAKR